MNMSRDISENSQSNVDEEVTATAGDKRCRRWREDDSDNNEENVRTFDHCEG